jgi:hypothetical protein
MKNLDIDRSEAAVKTLFWLVVMILFIAVVK